MQRDRHSLFSGNCSVWQIAQRTSAIVTYPSFAPIPPCTVIDHGNAGCTRFIDGTPGLVAGWLNTALAIRWIVATDNVDTSMAISPRSIGHVGHFSAPCNATSCRLSLVFCVGNGVVLVTLTTQIENAPNPPLVVSSTFLRVKLALSTDMAFGVDRWTDMAYYVADPVVVYGVTVTAHEGLLVWNVYETCYDEDTCQLTYLDLQWTQRPRRGFDLKRIPFLQITSGLGSG
ncbi:hypothetical protein GYMLUDRAFT_242045 [Collybiopsis luxurians FD-317 M1]|uniref:Uncharacterized protein n=1 Tax=Collybiopsis luxurians FD-317 M1 TaxID=944289 RepID=A0A0D0CU16_9AGAR|nr:hypothetical protein GYMLUDRAFT_242045 [Collybiopsis luxurians FD-317 M1]